MKNKLATLGFALLSVVLLLVACEQRAPTPTGALTRAPTRVIGEEWSISPDKYVFIERWIEIYQDSTMSAFIDFPTYRFDQNSGELTPDIVPPGRWFPLEDLTELKVVYGRGTKRTGPAGTGTNSQVFAATGLPFTEPPKWDTDVVVMVESVDTHGVAFLRRGNERIVLQPGESWTKDGKSTIEWGGVKSEILSKERISNFGVLDKSGIQVTTGVQKAIEIAVKDPSVQEEISGEGYELGEVQQDEFFVFPAVELNIPPDRRVEGMVLWVPVDLEAKRVVKIISTPRKSLPPDMPR